MYSTATTLESSPAMDDIDSAVESACRLFLSTKTLVESNAGTVDTAAFGQSGDEFNTHMDFIETMVFATSRLIRQTRDKQNGGHVDDSNFSSYGKLCMMYARESIELTISTMRRYDCYGEHGIVEDLRQVFDDGRRWRKVFLQADDGTGCHTGGTKRNGALSECRVASSRRRR